MADDMHITGLGQTSFDISGIIEKMLEIKAQPEKAWLDEQQVISDDVTAWSDLSALMTNLTDSLNTLRGYDLWNKMSATTSDSTKLTATAASSAVNASYNIEIDDLAQAHSVRSKDFTSTTADLVGGTLTAGNQFAIGGVTFTVGADEYGQTVSGTESLTTLVSKINYASSSMTTANRVVASIISSDATHNYLVLTRVNTGATDISSSDTGAGTALQNLDILSALGAYNHELVLSQDASFSIDTIAMTRSSNTGITDALSGVTLNLLAETTSAVKLTVEQDQETVKAAILDFIDQYNALSDQLLEYGQIVTAGSELDPNGATVDSTGQLYDDPLVAEIARNIRLQATGSKYPYLNPVNAAYTYGGRTGIMCSLQDIGIGTTGKDNQLSVLDENRLDSLLESNFAEVEQLFRGVYDATAGYQHGVASDFYTYSNSVSTSMTGSIAQHVEALDDKSARLQQQIDDWEAYLADYEAMLWAQFTAMDSAITAMQTNLSGLGNLAD